MAQMNATQPIIAAPAPQGSRITTAAKPSEAKKSSDESSRTHSTQEKPPTFASALKSQMEKKPADATGMKPITKETKAASDTSGSAQAGSDSVDSTDSTGFDLATLLPLMVETVARQDSKESADAGFPKELDISQTPQLSPMLTDTKIPATGELPAPEQMAAVVNQVMPQTRSIPATAESDTKTSNTSTDEDLGPSRGSILLDKAGPTAKSEKFAVDAAIAAATSKVVDSSDSHDTHLEDFRGFLDRATALTTGNVSSTTSASTLRVDTPMGQAGWHDELGQKLSWVVNKNQQQAELVLNPAQLGRIEVTLTLNGDQASMVFTSANPAVREALEDSMQKLREVLADAGVNLGQTNVGSESPRQSANADDQRGQRDPSGAGQRGVISVAGDRVLNTINSQSGRSSSGRSMVDLFA